MAESKTKSELISKIVGACISHYLILPYLLYWALTTLKLIPEYNGWDYLAFTILVCFIHKLFEGIKIDKS